MCVMPADASALQVCDISKKKNKIVRTWKETVAVNHIYPQYAGLIKSDHGLIVIRSQWAGDGYAMLVAEPVSP